MVGHRRVSSGNTTVVIEERSGVPAISWWGGGLLGEFDGAVDPTDRAVPHGTLDVVAPLAIVAEHASGFAGRPGLEGHRDDGSDWAPRFAIVDVIDIAGMLTYRCRDSSERLELTVEFDATAPVIGLRLSLTNLAADRYWLSRLAMTVPLTARASEVATYHGRWCGEFDEQRTVLAGPALVVETRRGRTSHDRSPTALCGTGGFGHNHGEVWAVHTAWSGNHELRIERLSDGLSYLQAGELLLPGEIVLGPGETYDGPTAHLAWSGAGGNGISHAFHDLVRSFPSHRPTPRPVTLNTWEAVYFDHDFSVLTKLAEGAAEIGVERFVLDDGWFLGRRNDRAGLGDWFVDESIHVGGLTPLVDHVRSLGMQFGLWVEPEMVNPDSELYRTHPDWALGTDDGEPVMARNQLVLDLANADVVAYLLERLDAILSGDSISYLKWDMNRDLVSASHEGRASVHRQTLALYALIDELRRRHPEVEIESCASGGGRTDLAILRRTERIWTSDNNDAHDRQRIQQGFSVLFPPEVMGAHIGPTRSHTTGRRHELAFRAATAFFGHLGIEWNLLTASSDDLARLASIVALHRRLRPLLHRGVGYRLDLDDSGSIGHSVVSIDRTQALVSLSCSDSARSTVRSPLRLAGLDAAQGYRVEIIDELTSAFGPMKQPPRWMAGDHVVISGGELMSLGIPLPILNPDSAVLLQLRAASVSTQR